jgi:hypothetical protein
MREKIVSSTMDDFFHLLFVGARKTKKEEKNA